MRLTVAVVTYRRPTELARALPVILDHVRALNALPEGALDADVIVVDNDAAATAQPVARALDSPLVRYVVEPLPGIAAARNRALDETLGSDLLVFIDDDEQPRDGWLAHLVATWRTTRAAAVSGRVISEFADALDPWVAAGDFFRRRSLETGTEIRVAAAGNLLLDLHQIRELGVRFDSSLGLSGGEDTLFSRELHRRAGRIVWCEESAATDFVPPARTTRRWVLRRAWSHGNTESVIDLYLAGSASRRLAARFSGTAQGLVRMIGGGGRYVLGVLTRSLRHQARGLRAACRGTGMVSGAFGVVYEEYGRTKA
ncbi:hypothetical protein GY21_18555 [Cryobacterium roopkundense]|uniref:Glycosyltransferase 2-like domain-containing protein n=1 Tax=Cryobacterium roopkundense TaxID=1001240 RepID=A0A099J121_9MICO|nr:hypothetical protein GY21_18555 [Cryobacterium roopkundense]